MLPICALALLSLFVDTATFVFWSSLLLRATSAAPITLRICYVCAPLYGTSSKAPVNSKTTLCPVLYQPFIMLFRIELSIGASGDDKHTNARGSVSFIPSVPSSLKCLSLSVLPAHGTSIDNISHTCNDQSSDGFVNGFHFRSLNYPKPCQSPNLGLFNVSTLSPISQQVRLALTRHTPAIDVCCDGEIRIQNVSNVIQLSTFAFSGKRFMRT